MNEKTLEEVLEDWKEERIGAREAIEEILRHHLLLRERLRALERSIAPRPPAPPPAPPKRAAKRR